MAFATIGNSALTGSIDLTSKVTGTLPVANGGTALSSGFVNGGGITEADFFILNAQYDSAASGNKTFTNEFVRATGDSAGRIGTGISLDTSNGKYTFTNTGIYLILVTVGASLRDGNDNEAHFNLMVNGSDVNYIYVGANTGTNNVSNTGMAPFIVDIDSAGASGDYVQLKCGGDGVIYHAGGSSYHQCSISFYRLGAT